MAGKAIEFRSYRSNADARPAPTHPLQADRVHRFGFTELVMTDIRGRVGHHVRHQCVMGPWRTVFLSTNHEGRWRAGFTLIFDHGVYATGCRELF